MPPEFYFVISMLVGAIGMVAGFAYSKRNTPTTETKPSSIYEEFDHPPDVLATLYTEDQLRRMISSLREVNRLPDGPTEPIINSCSFPLEYRLLGALKRAIVLHGLREAEKKPIVTPAPVKDTKVQDVPLTADSEAV